MYVWWHRTFSSLVSGKISIICQQMVKNTQSALAPALVNVLELTSTFYRFHFVLASSWHQRLPEEYLRRKQGQWIQVCCYMFSFLFILQISLWYHSLFLSFWLNFSHLPEFYSELIFINILEWMCGSLLVVYTVCRESLKFTNSDSTTGPGTGHRRKFPPQHCHPNPKVYLFFPLLWQSGNHFLSEEENAS